MATADAYERLVAALRRLPTCSVLVWSDDTSGDTPTLDGDLLVWVPDVARPLGWSWIWSIAETEPEEGLSPIGLVVDAEQRTPEQLSAILSTWVLAHTGRADLSFVYDPALTSDWVLEVAHGDQPELECVQSPDGRIHTLGPSPGSGGGAWTRCGRLVEDGWNSHSGELSFPVDMTEADEEAEWDRICC